MNPQRLTIPWAGRTSLYSTPGSFILKMALGEAPEAIPSTADVRVGACHPVNRIRIGSVDRIITHFSSQVQVTRVHTAAASLGQLGQQHVAFNDLEQILGLSRTFRVQTEPQCGVGDLVDALRQVAVVEQAYPHYLSTVPFAVAPAAATMSFDAPLRIATDPLHESDGWASRRQVRAIEALAYEEGDPAVIVGVIDTGVAQNHYEFLGRLQRGVDTVQLSSTQLAQGIELVGDLGGIDIDPEDNVGHGTACVGIIGAEGQQMPPGLAGNCRLLPVRVLGAARFPGKQELAGVGALADIDHGVKMAVDLGAKVINMSFGTPESVLDPADPVPHSDVVRYGLAKGCIMIAASGNSGKMERYAPASLEHVIAVGAVDQHNRPASFSTGGDHVDIAAPGIRVLSTGLNGYQLVTGTSFAAPFVAATAALLVSRSARRAYPLDSAAVRRILRASADPWTNRRVQGQGVGILNAYAALQELDREIDRGMMLFGNGKP